MMTVIRVWPDPYVTCAEDGVSCWDVSREPGSATPGRGGRRKRRRAARIM